MKSNPLTPLLVLLLILCCSDPLLSQIEPENLGDDWEIWYDKIPVSGEIRVGIVDEFSDAQINPSSFYVSLPGKMDKQLCVELNSRDGRYKAHLRYSLSNAHSGINKFIWPTDHVKELKKFNRQDLTILCSISESCAENSEYFTLASWEHSSSSDTLFVLLNAQKAPKISIENKSSGEEVVIECKKLKLEPMITYNCQCAIPTKVLDQESDIKIVKRVRKINRISYKRYPLPIKIFK